ncbi:hypothetical protein [Chengkuizengella axinellae]|uniref:Uncharacterized protein n=1 Tax=Chengkuizengella axinellae TaxID=3064388 RepID=A0ABT9IXH3_9BACL|nr:hypothetical protein [Chengkuizengella sp. 2205SS18-9]MDP5274017.1 hypothetical protein [Chengkuizengella sp. 2205SS18-9]
MSEEPKDNEIRKYKVILKNDQVIEVTGDVELFSEESPRVNMFKIEHCFNAKDVLYITRV